jgi:hypothetical protein
MGEELGTGEIMRKEVVGNLLRVLPRSTTADIQRATQFLEWAFDIRIGCRKQRNASRKRQGL